MLPKGNAGVNFALVSSWKHLCWKRPLRSLIPTVLCFPEDKAAQRAQQECCLLVTIWKNHLKLTLRLRNECCMLTD